MTGTDHKPPSDDANVQLHKLLNFTALVGIDATKAEVAVRTNLGTWSASTLSEALKNATVAYESLDRGRP